MATFRRHGAKLLSIGDGHGNLVMVISQFKELRNATKAVISAQTDTIEDKVIAPNLGEIIWKDVKPKLSTLKDTNIVTA